VTGRWNLVSGLLVMVLLVTGGVKLITGPPVDQVNTDQVLAHVRDQEKGSCTVEYSDYFVHPCCKEYVSSRGTCWWLYEVMKYQ
jgi:hypothetical protein